MASGRWLTRINLVRWLAVLLCGWLSLAAMATEVKGVRVWPSPDSTRVVLDLSGPPDYSHFTLSSPNRLVIDLKSARNRAALEALDNKGLVSRIRSSASPSAGGLRLVLDLKGEVRPVLFPLRPAEPYGDRLVIDLFPKAEAPAASGSMAASSSATSGAGVIKSVATTAGQRDVVIAIDAGHGGEDPGAIGPKKTKEKKVTLAIAKKVAAQLNAESGIKAVLIRTGDYYVNLNRRTELARQHGADLLVSIHADAVASRTPHGASAWVLSSRRAQSELGRWLEQHEKQSELLGGAGDLLQGSSERYLTQALLDMSMDHSREIGFSVSRRVLQEMGKVTHLHKRHPESASLAVLKAPDIPSLLIETGFISNPAEEKKLATDAHQTKLARAIVRGIKSHFVELPPEGTLLAARKAGLAPRSAEPKQVASAGDRKHKVTRGESLSGLARRYNTSVAALVRANDLSDENIRIGQVLTIPGS